jgi:hypothetical protein
VAWSGWHGGGGHGRSGLRHSPQPAGVARRVRRGGCGEAGPCGRDLPRRVAKIMDTDERRRLREPFDVRRRACDEPLSSCGEPAHVARCLPPAGRGSSAGPYLPPPLRLAHSSHAGAHSPLQRLLALLFRASVPTCEVPPSSYLHLRPSCTCALEIARRRPLQTTASRTAVTGKPVLDRPSRLGHEL